MVELTEAAPSDYPEIIALTNRAYREAAGQTGWKVETLVAGQRIDASLLAEDLAAPGAVLLVARDAMGRVGHVRLDDQGGGAWYLSMLTVDPARQDGGLGREILAACEAWARQRGATRMRMSVLRQRAELIAWYGRRGYRPTGEEKPFPYVDARFGVPTRDDLAFVVLEKAL
ncbi:GNAT family N-acetyltransferase [uncultured Phenylobacterium sp.]|uniref:GNAT family N-acetyltransferase n=1 Tax=uncultured Phenylobacterium sp. TaxID=349273 RepID=UPI0025D64C29|nr:GNAT family N-acetyltransferase [uncultured Phenylobacterium sp.]